MTANAEQERSQTYLQAFERALEQGQDVRIARVEACAAEKAERQEAAKKNQQPARTKGRKEIGELRLQLYAELRNAQEAQTAADADAAAPEIAWQPVAAHSAPPEQKPAPYATALARPCAEADQQEHAGQLEANGEKKQADAKEQRIQQRMQLYAEVRQAEKTGSLFRPEEQAQPHQKPQPRKRQALTITQKKYLLLLAYMPEAVTSRTQLAQKMSLTRAAVSRVTLELAEQGLITVYSRCSIGLSEKGKQAAQQLSQHYSDVEKAMLHKLLASWSAYQPELAALYELPPEAWPTMLHSLLTAPEKDAAPQTESSESNSQTLAEQQYLLYKLTGKQKKYLLALHLEKAWRQRIDKKVLAEQIAVNEATVAKAMEELQQLGLVEQYSRWWFRLSQQGKEIASALYQDYSALAQYLLQTVPAEATEEYRQTKLTHTLKLSVPLMDHLLDSMTATPQETSQQQQRALARSYMTLKMTQSEKQYLLELFCLSAGKSIKRKDFFLQTDIKLSQLHSAENQLLKLELLEEPTNGELKLSALGRLAAAQLYNAYAAAVQPWLQDKALAMDKKQQAEIKKTFGITNQQLQKFLEKEKINISTANSKA